MGITLIDWHLNWFKEPNTTPKGYLLLGSSTTAQAEKGNAITLTAASGRALFFRGKTTAEQQEWLQAEGGKLVSAYSEAEVAARAEELAAKLEQTVASSEEEKAAALKVAWTSQSAALAAAKKKMKGAMARAAASLPRSNE